MSARYVHAVLAAALDNPEVLERWRRDGSLAKEVGGEAAALDLERLRLFSGLATKVRQNDVRLALPLTFRLLDHLELSIELFAAYAAPAASLRKSGKRSRSDKILSLLQFLDGWLDHDDLEHALVVDIMRHERALLDLRDGRPAVRASASAQGGASPRFRASSRSKPRRCARFIHHEMSCNPLTLAAMLRAGTFDPEGLGRGRFFFAYRWDDHAACINVDEIDALGSVLIDLADGSLSLARMAACLRQAGLEVQARDVQAVVQDLVDYGLLTFDGARS
jgi:hypothetical protein